MNKIKIHMYNFEIGCKSDCQDECESAIESCKEQHDDPDDADMLKTCIDDAKSEYESCIHECES